MLMALKLFMTWQGLNAYCFHLSGRFRAGKEGIDELTNQVGEYLDGKEMTANILPSASAEKHYPIAFNLIPQIDVFCDNLYTKEEMKMVNETRKILDDYDMRITATTIVCRYTAAILNLLISSWKRCIP